MHCWHFILLFGLSVSDEGKCINIANDTSGIIQCGPSQHIHMEKIWLGNDMCLSKSPRAGFYMYKTAIPNITCQNGSICTVPFLSGIHKYLNIHFQCTGCLSVLPGEKRVISCPENTIINIYDVWYSKKYGCPAYNQTHTINNRNFYISCEGGLDCDISNRRNYTVLSIYFHCKEISTSTMNPLMISNIPSISREKVQSTITSITNGLSQEMSSFTASSETTIPVGHTLNRQAKKTFPGAVMAGAVAAGIIILFLPFVVLLYRRRYKNSLHKPRRKCFTRSNPTYESGTDEEINYNKNINMESSFYSEPVELENDQDIVKTSHDYVNTDNITYDYTRENNYLKDDNMQQEVGSKQQSEEMDSNTYSHLQDTFIDSDEKTYDHAIHNRIVDMLENDYYVSRSQRSDDDYDVCGIHNRANHMDRSDTVYN